jgi:hypothetical protein
MRKSRFTTEQTVGFLTDREPGTKVSDPCRRLRTAITRFTAGRGNTADWKYRMRDA